MVFPKLNRSAANVTAVGVAFGLVMLSLGGAIVFAQPSPELAFIQQHIDDESAVVDAVRDFDRIQQALIEGDVEAAQELAASGDEEAAEAKMAEARKRLTLIDEAWKLVLARHSESARALTYQGELLYDRFGDQMSAIRNWKLATTLDESLSEPYNNLGLHYCHVGEYEQGLRALDEALDLDKDRADYHYNMAQIYLVHSPQVREIRGWRKKKLFKEAMEHSKRAAELAPDDYDLVEDYAVNFFAAENLDVKADWKDAAEAWKAAREVARNDTEVFYTWLNEARAWMNEEDPKRAEPCLEEALALQPGSDVVKRLLEEVRGEAD
jgi:tetratricopeptide (TPR) repeat protein